MWIYSYGKANSNTHYHSPGSLHPACIAVSLCLSPLLFSLHKSLWCIFHTSLVRCEILKLQIWLRMTCSTPPFFVRRFFFFFSIDVNIGWSKDGILIHVILGMFSQVLAKTLDLVTVWHNALLSLLVWEHMVRQSCGWNTLTCVYVPWDGPDQSTLWGGGCQIKHCTEVLIGFLPYTFLGASWGFTSRVILPNRFGRPLPGGIQGEAEWHFEKPGPEGGVPAHSSRFELDDLKDPLRPKSVYESMFRCRDPFEISLFAAVTGFI